MDVRQKDFKILDDSHPVVNTDSTGRGKIFIKHN